MHTKSVGTGVLDCPHLYGGAFVCKYASAVCGTGCSPAAKIRAFSAFRRGGVSPPENLPVINGRRNASPTNDERSRQRKKDTRRCPLLCQEATKKIFFVGCIKVSNSNKRKIITTLDVIGYIMVFRF